MDHFVIDSDGSDCRRSDTVNFSKRSVGTLPLVMTVLAAPYAWGQAVSPPPAVQPAPAPAPAPSPVPAPPSGFFPDLSPAAPSAPASTSQETRTTDVQAHT